MWEIFEQLVREKGITVQDVSRETGINQSTFAQWKRRNSTISRENGIKIAEYLGVTYQYLMTGTDPEGYYENDETARIAQEIHDNRELRVLFSAAKDVSPKMVKALYEVLLIMKRAEEGENEE